VFFGGFCGQIGEMPVKQLDYRRTEARLKVGLLRARIWLTCFLAAGAFLSAALKLVAIFQLMPWG
jgi:hypothetical protein